MEFGEGAGKLTDGGEMMRLEKSFLDAVIEDLDTEEEDETKRLSIEEAQQVKPEP